MILIDKVTSLNKPDTAVVIERKAVTRWLDCVNDIRFIKILKFITPLHQTAEEVCTNFNDAISKAVLGELFVKFIQVYVKI
jgi:hypothetical protein